MAVAERYICSFRIDFQPNVIYLFEVLYRFCDITYYMLDTIETGCGV